MNRRDFLLAATASALLAELRAQTKNRRWKVGMYQGSLRAPGPEVFDLAKRIGLDGVELLMGRVEDGLPLRKPEVRRQYVEAAKRAGLEVPSLCPNVMNSVGLKSEPRAGIWLIDTIEACRDFGAKNILVPFFSKGELKMENTDDVARVVDVLKEAAPRAVAADVTLGLENTLSAEDNMALLEKINAPGVLVYYDIGNSANRGRDVAAEIRKLGRRYICQLHIKDNPSYLGQGKIDIPAVAAAVREIEFEGWLVLETTSPTKDVEKDTKVNLEYLKKVFAFQSA